MPYLCPANHLCFEGFTFYCIVLYEENDEAFASWQTLVLTKIWHSTPLKRPCRTNGLVLNCKWYFTTSVLKKHILQTSFHPFNVGDLLLTHFHKSFNLMIEQTWVLLKWLFIYFKSLTFLLSLAGKSDPFQKGKKSRASAIPMNVNYIHHHLVLQNSGTVFVASWHLLAVASHITHGLLYWVCFATNS